MAEVKKEVRLPDSAPVPVYEVEVASYGTVIIEVREVQRYGTIERFFTANGFADATIVGSQTSTRTRDYLNNLPAYSGKK